MYEDQCKVDRDGADSDASSSEPTTGRDAAHSPGPVSSPLRLNRGSRGKSKTMNKLYCYASRSLEETSLSVVSFTRRCIMPSAFFKTILIIDKVILIKQCADFSRYKTKRRGALGATHRA